MIRRIGLNCLRFDTLYHKFVHSSIPTRHVVSPPPPSPPDLSCMVKRVKFARLQELPDGGDADAVNCLYYGHLMEHLSLLHHGRELHLSQEDLRALPAMLKTRHRPPHAGESPLSNTDVGRWSANRFKTHNPNIKLDSLGITMLSCSNTHNASTLLYSSTMTSTTTSYSRQIRGAPALALLREGHIVHPPAADPPAGDLPGPEGAASAQGKRG